MQFRLKKTDNTTETHVKKNFSSDEMKNRVSVNQHGLYRHHYVSIKNSVEEFKNVHCFDGFIVEVVRYFFCDIERLNFPVIQVRHHAHLWVFWFSKYLNRPVEFLFGRLNLVLKFLVFRESLAEFFFVFCNLCRPHQRNVLKDCRNKRILNVLKSSYCVIDFPQSTLGKSTVHLVKELGYIKCEVVLLGFPKVNLINNKGKREKEKKTGINTNRNIGSIPSSAIIE